MEEEISLWKRTTFVDLNLKVLYSYNKIKDPHSAIKKYLKNYSATYVPVNHIIYPKGGHDLQSKNSSQYKCLIEIKKELIFAEADLQAVDAKGKVKIALLVPTLNTHFNPYPGIRKFLLDSLASTLNEEELKLYHLTVYIGYDHGDPFFGNGSDRLSELQQAYKFLSFRLIQFPKTNWLTFIWNRLFVLAFREGNDYFLQLNDDIRFLNKNWLKKTINLLGPEGVVGFNDMSWKCKLYTQAMVNRAHYERFHGFFYPPQIKNWYSDNWITSNAYPQNQTKCCTEAVVQNGNIKTRYPSCSIYRTH